MNKTFFILEVETGLFDGWYFNGAEEGMLEYWNNKRPQYSHILAEAKSKVSYIPDNRTLRSWKK